MVLFNCEAALQLILLIVTLDMCWCDAGIETFLQVDLDKVDKSCGVGMNIGCCPNLQHTFIDTTIKVTDAYKGGPDTCRCRCSDETGSDESKKVIKIVDSGTEPLVKHHFCKAGFGPTVPSTQSPGASGGAGGADGSVSGASILQLCKLMVFVVPMAAGAILVISY